MYMYCSALPGWVRSRRRAIGNSTACDIFIYRKNQFESVINPFNNARLGTKINPQG